MASPKDDPQRDLVYAVEKLHLAGHARHYLKRWCLDRWTRQICRDYKVKRPKLRIGKCLRGAGGQYDPDTRTITLDPDFGCNGLVLLHELAHHICGTRYPKAQDHGAAFCRIFGELLDRTRLVPYAGWKAVCERHGVKVLRYLPKVK